MYLLLLLFFLSCQKLSELNRRERETEFRIAY